MKTWIKLFVMATVMLFAMGATTSCSSDEDFISSDEMEKLENDENVKLIGNFLSKTFPYGEDTNHKFLVMAQDNYKGFESYDYENPPCIVINSREQLASAYKGEMEIPEVDLSKLSVIIGAVFLPCCYNVYIYDNMDIKNSKDETTVTLNFSVREGVNLVYPALSIYYFYKIVPKFNPGKTIRAEAKCPPLPW